MRKSHLNFETYALAYNSYLTEYLLFSNSYDQFATIGSNGISTEYFKCLKFMVCENISKQQVYPLLIMNRLKKFVKLLLESNQAEEDRQILLSIKKVLDETEWKESFDI